MKMSLISILETLFIGPLKLLFEVIFQVANRFVNHPGVSIIFLSLIMNVLVLPLYRQADAMQEAARDTDLRLRKGVEHIKKTFSGDERMMILQAYYRQNNYKPTDALNGSVSLLLEIPFFMAAYQFLSNLKSIEGISLGPIADLSAPDGLLVIGGVALNLLPVLMTLVNVISSALYLKGFPLKTKIQLYGMAAFFLVFLYESPSGLVFYWTLNNLFSLVKTIFYKLKNPKKVLTVLLSVAGITLIVFAGFFYHPRRFLYNAALLALGGVMLLPLLISLLKKSKLSFKLTMKEREPNKKLFVVSSLFLTVLMGLLIPSTFIAASPQEFVDTTNFFNPIWYIVSATCLAAGTFLVWLRVFYWLANKKGKVIFEYLTFALCGVAFVNYMFFGTDLGVISSTLKYNEGLYFTLLEQLGNLAVMAVVIAGMVFCAIKWKKVAVSVVLISSIAFGAMSGLHINTINAGIRDVSVEQASDKPYFNLSTTGKNVVVLMLDRSFGGYVPYMMEEKPELKEQFAGFTYYSNVLSFGAHTNFGAPALYGGYEYTPVEMNKRDEEALVIKHNEAIQIMPSIFDKKDFEVTVCDPVYAGYRWIPDLSIYKDYKNTKAYITEGQFGDTLTKEQVVANNLRNFFCFSLMKSMPVAAQPILYSQGTYLQAVDPNTNSAFLSAYSVLTNMSNMTKVTDGNKNTFMMLANNTAHEPTLLETPGYTPSTDLGLSVEDSFCTKSDGAGNTIRLNSAARVKSYHVNMAAFVQLGQWFDYLRENNLYDNTRIILVSDHGDEFGFFEQMDFSDQASSIHCTERYFPLLMVKDFGSTEYTTSDAFMTNADVPLLAMEGLVENPVNPFTGKPLTDTEKTAHPQYVIRSNVWDLVQNNGNTFLPSMWASVQNNIWDKDNWNMYNDEVVLKDHIAP